MKKKTTLDIIKQTKPRCVLPTQVVPDKRREKLSKAERKDDNT